MSNEGSERRSSRTLETTDGEVTQLSQQLQQRRVIRLRYRHLMDKVPCPASEETEEQEKNLDSLTSTLAEANAIFGTLPQMPREAALDSRLVNQLSTLGASIAHKLDTNVVTFFPKKFTKHLANYISETENTVTDWGKFGKVASSFFKRAPPLTFMYGSFETDQPDMPEKQKEKRAALNLKATGEKQAPENIREMGKGDREEVTTSEVEKVLYFLRFLCDKYKRPLCFFEFVVDPKSFTQTVLNIFHVSFLVRDEYVIIYLDHDGLPVIEAITNETGGPNSNAPKPIKNEVALTMNKSQWRAIVKEFKIEQASIPSTTSQLDHERDMAGPSSA